MQTKNVKNDSIGKVLKYLLVNVETAYILQGRSFTVHNKECPSRSVQEPQQNHRTNSTLK